MCALARAGAWYARNTEKVNARDAANYAADPNPARQRAAARRHADPDKHRVEKRGEYQRHRQAYITRSSNRWRSKRIEILEVMRDWRRRNPAKVSCQAALATKLRKRRRPSWLTAEHKARILAFYVEARRLGLETGLEHHVDHIVPLRGKTVSGLHVPWNLQVLPGSLNRSKSNKF